MSAEGLKQRKGGKREEEKPLLGKDKEDKPKPAVRRVVCRGTSVWVCAPCVGWSGWTDPAPVTFNTTTHSR